MFPARLSRRTALVGLLAGLAGGFSAAGRAWSRSIDAAIWQQIVDGDLAGAVQALDWRVAEYKFDKEARFTRARLSYALGRFETAREDFHLLLRSMSPPAPGLFSLRFVPELRDVHAWLYLSDGSLGRKVDLAPALPDSVISLLRGDVARNVYVQANLDIWQGIIAKINAETRSIETDGQAPVTIVFKLPDNVPSGFEFIADFALAQQALMRQDVSSARKMLERAIAYEADTATEFYIAKKQLSDIS